jgi:hypothetical protein
MEFLPTTLKEPPMNAKSILVMSALAIAAGAASADDSSVRSSPLTRAEVRQAVVTARAAGLLVPAGEGEIRLPQQQVEATLSRADVKRDVIVAQRTGQLIPAGEGEWRARVEAKLSGVQLARSDVKAETRRAQAAGELTPAGEGNYDHEVRHARASTSFAIASARPHWLRSTVSR